MKIMRGAVIAKAKPSYRGEPCEEMKGQSDYLNRGGVLPEKNKRRKPWILV